MQGGVWNEIGDLSVAAARSGSALVDAERGPAVRPRRRRAPRRRPECALRLDARAHRFGRRRPRSGAFAGRQARRRGRPVVRSRACRTARAAAGAAADAGRDVVRAAHPPGGARLAGAPGDAVRRSRRVQSGRWRSRSRSSPRSIARFRSTTSPTASPSSDRARPSHWPRYSKVMDYELEVGDRHATRPRRTFPAREAGAHIFGYTIFNDFSARDRQAIEMQGRLGPAKGKSFDGAQRARALDRHAGRTGRSARP